MAGIGESFRLWVAATVVPFLSLEEQVRACETNVQSLEDAQAYCSTMLCQLNDRDEVINNKVVLYMWTTTALVIRRWPTSKVAKDAQGVRAMLTKRTRLRTLQSLFVMFICIGLACTLLYQAIKYGPVRQDHRLKPL